MSFKQLNKNLVAGLLTVVPLMATIFLVYWFASSAEEFLGRFIRMLVPEKFYWPGIGLLAGIILLYMIGLMMQAWVVKILFSWADNLLYRVPLVKVIYGSIRDFVDFLQGHKQAQKRVVAVSVDDNAKMIGFVTREDLSDLPGEVGKEGWVAVYFPLSYQIGGYTLLLKRSDLEPLDISLEHATRFLLTAGIGKERKRNKQPH